MVWICRQLMHRQPDGLQIILLDCPFELITPVEFLDDAVPAGHAIGPDSDGERDLALQLDEWKLAKR